MHNDPLKSAHNTHAAKRGKKLRSADAKIVRFGHDRLVFRDLYVNLLSMPWILLLGLVAVFYLVVNLVFAEMYFQHIDGIENAKTFLDVFFFSVQTMATIGYGHMTPVSEFTNGLTAVEVLIGFIYFAFITGLMFAKFSRPTAHVLFTNVAVISNHEGKPHLKIRLANKRANRIVDATAKIFLLRVRTTKEGMQIREFIDLPVVRDYLPMLRLTWTLLHPIDANSPLCGLTQQDMEASEDEVFVTISGLDETLSQTISARHSYLPDEIIFGAFFEDVVSRNDDRVELNYNNFHRIRYRDADA